MAASYQVYVSFSGEAGAKIQNVGALSSAGTYLGEVLNGGGPYDELRGLAVDGAGRLYVANAYKKGSSVDVFSATVNADGYSRDYLDTLITPKSTQALLHPYGVAFDEDNLFVSSQDTNVVSGYAISGKKMPSAKTLGVAPYLKKLAPKGDYYDGTFVASATPVPIGKKKPTTPPAVDPKDGGLSMSGFDPQTVEQEPHAADAADAAKPAQAQARHSVRGIAFQGKRLYVCDEAADRIGIYGHKNGTFHGWVSTTNDTSANPNAMQSPVGIAVSPSGVVYVGSPGNEAIFAYDPQTQELTLVISSASSSTAHVPSAAEALKDLSGLSCAPDGTLIFGSRKNQQLYQIDLSTGALSTFGEQLKDAPECVLVVGLSS